jgi:hypothetical protein
MAQLFANNAISLLAAGITNVATSLTVTTGDGALYPSPTGGDYFMLTLTQAGSETSWEVVKVTARTGDVLTVVRAQEGTTAAAWALGCKAELRVTAESLNALSTAVIAYASRATLRSLSPNAGAQAVVDGLGLFVWESASTEPDDDESAFATASGVWLLQAAHWDLVDAWQAPEWQAVADDDEDEPLRFASKVLTGSATCAITSVGTLASTSFTGTVTGAAVGDRVVATPPAQLGSTAADTAKLGYHAWVSAANTVTIMLTNASAASATTNAAIQTAWPVTVIKT